MRMDAINPVLDPTFNSEVRAPTVPEGEITRMFKFDFNQKFVRPNFLAKDKVFVYDRFKRKKKQSRQIFTGIHSA